MVSPYAVLERRRQRLCVSRDIPQRRCIMPYGGNDWLALTQEPTLEPEIPICDPHHHFWDFRTDRLPYQRYLLHELIADINCGHNVRSEAYPIVKTKKSDN